MESHIWSVRKRERSGSGTPQAVIGQYPLLGLQTRHARQANGRVDEKVIDRFILMLSAGLEARSTRAVLRGDQPSLDWWLPTTLAKLAGTNHEWHRFDSYCLPTALFANLPQHSCIYTITLEFASF